MSNQQIINLVFAGAIVLMFIVIQEQAVKIEELKDNPPKTELEVCADALEGTTNYTSGGTFNKQQAILLCNASKR
jgi:hypothetical protein